MPVETLEFSDNPRLYRFRDVTLYPDGAWSSTHGSLRPLCYPQATTDIAIRASISSSDPVSPQLRVRAESSDPPMVFAGVAAPSAAMRYEGRLELTSGSVGRGVRTVRFMLNWACSRDGVQWRAMPSTGWHVLHVTHGPPLIGGPAQDRLYDRGLELACTYVAARPDVPDAICERIAADLWYDPTQAQSKHPLNLCKPGVRGRGDCINHAELMCHLCLSVGVPSRVVAVWGGTSSRVEDVRYFRRGSDRRSASIGLARPAMDEAEPEPHFRFHALAQVDFEGVSRLYDPSYGVSAPAAPETAPIASAQTTEYQPLPIETAGNSVDFVCGH